MRVHYCQHAPFEPPAAVAEWARSRGHTLAGTHLHEGEPLPAPGAVDLLVVLGGPMGVSDTEGHPWLERERELVLRALARDTPVLGVCLGAQQLAAALGADVTTGDRREVGWFPVETTGVAAHSPLAPLRPGFPALHWHGDRFDVPPSGWLLARTPARRNQAFLACDGLALGLGFHLEVTRESLTALVDATGDPEPGEYVQSRGELLSEAAPFGRVHSALFAVLDTFVAGV